MNCPALPEPSAEESATSQALCGLIQQRIQENNGFLPFADFMQLALYQPQYGYYTGGTHKIGAGGDFITAPALTPLFGQTLTAQLLPLLPQTAGNVYEFGAGTGALAAQLLPEISGSLKHYHIIEVSPDLAERQRRHLADAVPQYLHKISWLAELPAELDGIILGNEVLDAMPCDIVRRENGQWLLMGVSLDEAGQFQWQSAPLPAELAAEAQACLPAIDGYTSELHLRQQAFVRTLAARLTRGALLFLDYGFDAAQYYHPQRSGGTLIGHYRHHTVHNPFERVGLTDLTCHVNFTALTEAAVQSGLDLIGYATQAAFLLNLGLTERLAAQGSPESEAYIRAAAACQTLLAPQEMGELFKAIAFGRHIDPNWQGFAIGDLCHKL
ncbi:SAM-dependent methyltransferase [Eikenella sp. S3360]|uniref:SAM-dependent methyltransferase n=1 Tax=Eikenella glucosivorans TaxID=2766967 RepID=A0ABS0NAE2_9NEIS|nr:SAM-dependent methyltransferase [Eikenella glucosivorans]MBH5329267.1 SAM-dependent methyltransferase [Eikenella glucosivorans]